MTSSHLRISPCGHQCPPVRVYQAKGASEPPVSPNLVPRWAGGTSEPGDTHGCNCAIQTLLGPQGQASEGAPSLTDPGGPVRIHYLLRGVGNQSLVLHVHLFLSTLRKISKGRVCVLSHFSRVRLCVTLWTVAHQAPLSMGFSRQEYWSGWPCPPPGDLSDPGMEPRSLGSPALAGVFFCHLRGSVPVGGRGFLKIPAACRILVP